MNLLPLSRRAWTVLKILSPLFIYRLAQIFVGIPIHPAYVPFFNSLISLISRASLEEHRTKNLPVGYLPMRFSAESSTRHQIDGMFLKRDGVDLSGRCLLISHGNGMLYEHIMEDQGILDLANKLNAHILFYNYAGTGRSSGWFPNRDAMVASHEVMHSILQQIGTSQIFDFGWSIGGGVKWRDHFESPKKENTTIIDYQTFRSTSGFAKEPLGRVGEIIVKFLQWEYNSEEVSKKFQGQHIIVQDGNPETGEVFHDGVMSVENSLATGASSEKVILMNTRRIYSYTDLVGGRALFLGDPVHCLPLDQGTVNQIGTKIAN